MGFLTDVLPGLRDTRPAIASGYLWLATAWVSLSWVIPTRAEALAGGGFPAEVERLLSDLGLAGKAVALTFVAFAVGTATRRFGLRELIGRFLDPSRGAAALLAPVAEALDTNPEVRVDMEHRPAVREARQTLNAARGRGRPGKYWRYRYHPDRGDFVLPEGLVATAQRQFARQLTSIAANPVTSWPESMTLPEAQKRILDLATDIRLRSEKRPSRASIEAQKLQRELHLGGHAAARPHQVAVLQRRLHEAEFRTAISIPGAALLVAAATRLSLFVGSREGVLLGLVCGAAGIVALSIWTLSLLRFGPDESQWVDNEIERWAAAEAPNPISGATPPP